MKNLYPFHIKYYLTVKTQHCSPSFSLLLQRCPGFNFFSLPKNRFCRIAGVQGQWVGVPPPFRQLEWNWLHKYSWTSYPPTHLPMHPLPTPWSRVSESNSFSLKDENAPLKCKGITSTPLLKCIDQEVNPSFHNFVRTKNTFQLFLVFICFFFFQICLPIQRWWGCHFGAESPKTTLTNTKYKQDVQCCMAY